MISSYLDQLTKFTELRKEWSEHRDVAIQHLSACSNAVQEMTYLAATAQEAFTSNWELPVPSTTTTATSPPPTTLDYQDSDSESEFDSYPMYNPLALATARARATCTNTRDKEHRKLMASLSQLTQVVSQMANLYHVSTTEYKALVVQDEQWETARIGMTWCCSDVLKVMLQIVESYQSELFVKACIVDDMMKQTEIDVLLSYAATFLSEPYIDDNQLYSLMEASKYDLSNNKRGIAKTANLKD